MSDYTFYIDRDNQPVREGPSHVSEVLWPNGTWAWYPVVDANEVTREQAMEYAKRWVDERVKVDLDAPNPVELAPADDEETGEPVGLDDESEEGDDG